MRVTHIWVEMTNGCLKTKELQATVPQDPQATSHFMGSMMIQPGDWEKAKNVMVLTIRMRQGDISGVVSIQHPWGLVILTVPIFTIFYIYIYVYKHNRHTGLYS